MLDIECFQKGRAIKAGYVYPASFDRLPEVAGWDVVAGVDLLLDGIFSSRLAATALYTTSPSVAYLRIDLRIHHNGKNTALCFVLRGNDIHHVNLQCSYLLCKRKKPPK